MRLRFAKARTQELPRLPKRKSTSKRNDSIVFIRTTNATLEAALAALAAALDASLPATPAALDAALDASLPATGRSGCSLGLVLLPLRLKAWLLSTLFDALNLDAVLAAALDAPQ